MGRTGTESTPGIWVAKTNSFVTAEQSAAAPATFRLCVVLLKTQVPRGKCLNGPSGVLLLPLGLGVCSVSPPDPSFSPFHPTFCSGRLTCMEGFTCPLASHWVWQWGAAARAWREGGEVGGTIHQFLSGGLAWDQLCLSANVSASFKEALSFWGTSPFSPMG